MEHIGLIFNSQFSPRRDKLEAKILKLTEKLLVVI